MKCRQCGTEIADRALICFRCGASVTEPVTQPYTPKESRRSSLAYIIFAILVLVAMAILWLS